MNTKGKGARNGRNLITPTRKEIAKIASTSEGTIAKVKEIQKKASEEQKEKLISGELSINQVFNQIRAEERAKIEITPSKRR